MRVLQIEHGRAKLKGKFTLVQFLKKIIHSFFIIDIFHELSKKHLWKRQGEGDKQTELSSADLLPRCPL